MTPRLSAIPWMVAGVGLLVASCGERPARAPGSRGHVEGEFQRCLDQQKYGDAGGCWQMFVDRYAEVASTAEMAYAAQHAKPAAGAPADTDDRVANAARGPARGLVRMFEDNPADPTPPSPGGTPGPSSFPPATKGFSECYRGFQVTGDSDRDVQELGARCGVPCGMIPLSSVMSGRQAQDDDVDVYNIELRNDRCYRFFAVGDRGVDDLDSAIADSEGRLLIRDTMQDSAPILGPTEPFCPPYSGRYGFVLSVAKGAGEFRFQVWQGAKQ